MVKPVFLEVSCSVIQSVWPIFQGSRRALAAQPGLELAKGEFDGLKRARRQELRAPGLTKPAAVCPRPGVDTTTSPAQGGPEYLAQVGGKDRRQLIAPASGHGRLQPGRGQSGHQRQCLARAAAWPSPRLPSAPPLLGADTGSGWCWSYPNEFKAGEISVQASTKVRRIDARVSRLAAWTHFFRRQSSGLHRSGRVLTEPSPSPGLCTATHAVPERGIGCWRRRLVVPGGSVH
jgi:hypothetical protein